jgi:dienelactone hydrolase
VLIVRPSRLLGIAGLLFSIYICNPVQCTADQMSIPPAKAIQFEGDLPYTPNPLTLKGYLRRPDADGRHPAIVLLHNCDGNAERLDQNWGQRLASWGYVTLAVDSFGPRGIANICDQRSPRDLAFDPYRALTFLVRQPFVDAKRIVVMGISTGGTIALQSVERGAFEQMYENKFRAAVAFYPVCSLLTGVMTAPSLILIGELDKFAQGCRDMADGRSGEYISRTVGKGIPVRLVVYPDAYQGFDVPRFKTPVEYLGHHLEYNQSATEQSIEALREFLQTSVGTR